MVETSSNLPSTEASDVPEVSLALETARALWAKGLAAESVRWIQRAAENAESAGNDLRAVSLARAAADLRSEVSVSLPPPGPVTEAAALAPAGPVTEAGALGPYDDFTESTIVDSPASSLARVALQSSVQIAEMHPPPEPPVVVAPTTAVPSAQPTPALVHQAVRVCVLGGEAGGRELRVRILSEGENPPPGATPALLVALEPKVNLVP